MNILSIFFFFVILLKCVAASEDTLGVGFKKAVDEEDFEWLKENSRRWWRRGDLFDDVIARGIDATVKFIQDVAGLQNGMRLLHFLIREKEMIDNVLGGIKYDDDDLHYLTELSTRTGRFT